MENIKLSVLMPVRNESRNIQSTLKILQAFIEAPHEFIIIYDSPEDNTIPAVKEIQSTLDNIRLVHNNLGTGVINAIKAGIQHSKGEYILITVADDIGPAFAVNNMFALMQRGCDFVSCTRYAYGGKRLKGAFLERVISKFANRLFSLLTGSVFTDATTGVKMFKKNILNIIDLESRPIGWAVVFELAIKAQIAGLKLGEVPLISIDRLYGGKSTFHLWTWLKEYSRWFIWGFARIHRLKKNGSNKLLIMSDLCGYKEGTA